MITKNIKIANKWFDGLDGQNSYYILEDYILKSDTCYFELWRMLSIKARLEIYEKYKKWVKAK